MSRYIDANKLQKRIKTSPLFGNFGADGYFIEDFITDLIDMQPTADVVEVKHGEWINNHCTVCGRTPIGEESWTRSGLTPPKFELCMSFCPCCGAKMDG